MIPSALGRLLAATLATIAFLAACSGGAAAPASEPAPTSTLVSTPDIAALGALYLAAATAVNESAEANDAAWTPEEIKVGYRNYATALTDAMGALGKVEFPAPVQADVDTLIGLYGTSAGEWSKLADNPDYEAPLLTMDTWEQMRALDTRIRARSRPAAAPATAAAALTAAQTARSHPWVGARGYFGPRRPVEADRLAPIGANSGLRRRDRSGGREPRARSRHRVGWCARPSSAALPDQTTPICADSEV